MPTTGNHIADGDYTAHVLYGEQIDRLEAEQGYERVMHECGADVNCAAEDAPEVLQWLQFERSRASNSGEQKAYTEIIESIKSTYNEQ